MLLPLTDAAAAAALAGGGVLLLPTDTICGLHARADRPDALARIAALKGRAAGQPLLVLAASYDQATTLCGPLSAGQAALCRAAWPGPFTFILPAGAGLAGAVTDMARGTVAIRVPARADLRRLIEQAGGPLASTSANRSGQAPLAALAAAVDGFGDQVDGWWEGVPAPVDGSVAAGSPSALVDLTTDPPTLLRRGPVPLPEAGPGVS